MVMAVNLMHEGYPAWCPSCKARFEEPSGYTRVIGVSNHESIVAWRCPDCQHTWERDEGPLLGFRRCEIVFE